MKKNFSMSSKLQIFTDKLQLLAVLHFPLSYECNYHMEWHYTWKSMIVMSASIESVHLFCYYSHWQTIVANVTLPKAVRSTVEIFAVCFTTSSTTKTYVCAVNLRVITMVEFQIEAVLAYLHMICYRGLPKVFFWVKAEVQGSKDSKQIEIFLQNRRYL